MRWTATEKDGQQEGHFCRGEPQKGRQTWAGSHCPRQRLEASLPIPTSIVSAESPSARPGNAKEISGGGRDDSFQVSTQYAHILIDTKPNAAKT